ncbi:terpene synthase family protein [Aspergillus affinis]|uniref:terpene synthase family protein n=1 Tax=Aspergillus affinis TaxID=1070780 RepID=UPI0022FE5972|nr:terpenoid synthase [Aspergillus affinis]KAI9038147.1 terpenoid synthase [Aspergillus affinis]
MTDAVTVEAPAAGWCASPKLLGVSRKTNNTFFVRTVYPDAGLEELHTMVKLVCWLFVYDDALDYNDFKNMAPEREAYRNDAIRCIRDSMLGRDGYDKNPATIDSAYSLVQGFYEIGRGIREGLKNTDLCSWICDYLCDYVMAAAKLEEYADTEKIMDTDGYLDMRLDTSAIYPSIALCVLTDHIDLPRWILELEVTKKLMKLINIMGSIDNDMFSVKKELSLGHVDSLVPLLIYENSYSAQSGIDAAAALIRASYTEFCNLEHTLYDQVPPEHLDETRRLVQCWKDCRTGLANWHYASKRYYGISFGESQVISTTL